MEFNLLACIQNSIRCKTFMYYFYKADRYIIKYDRTKYQALFIFDVKYDTKIDRIRYITILRRNISDVLFS